MTLPPPVQLLIALAGIHGTVRTADHGAPLAGVSIAVDGGGFTSTDSAGHYALTGLKDGPHELRFAAFGYRPRRLTILLSDSSDLALDVELVPAPTILHPIEVIAASPRAASAGMGPDAANWQEAGRYQLAPGWQANQVAGPLDILQAVATVPGVTTRGDNATALSMHGGRGSENLVLLDGIPIIGALHFAGAASAVNPDAIGTLDVHTGVSSVRFGDALAGVIELGTSASRPARAGLTSTLSVSDVRSVFLAPIGNAGNVVIGGRSSFRNLLTDGSGLGSLNGYQDFIAAGHLNVGRGQLGIVTFASNDQLHWEPVADASLTGSADDGFTPSTAATGNVANWQSGAAGLTWTQPGGGTGQWHAAAWWTGSRTGISLINPSGTQVLSSGVSETGLSLERRQFYSSGSLLFGADLRQPATNYSLTNRSTVGPADITTIAAAPWLASLYGEWGWQASSRIGWRTGLRVSDRLGGGAVADPRAALNLRLDASTSVEVAGGRTHQTMQSLLNEENLASTIVGPALPVIPASGLPTASATQWQLSITRQFSRDVAVTLDGYRRAWENVVVPATTGTFLANGAPVFGAGLAHGLVASASIVHGPLSVQASAEVSSAVQHAGGVSYHTAFDAPWSVSGTASYRAWSRTVLQLRWQTGAGQPTTPVASGLEWHPWQPATGSGEIEGLPTGVPGPINAIRLAGAMRVDLGVRREWQLGGRSRITTTLRLDNLLGRANPVGVVAEPNGSLRLLPGTPRGVVFELGWVY